MGFYDVLDQVLDLLRQRQRVTYRALKREFNIDDDFLEDLKAELIYGQKLATDEDGRVLVWTGAMPPTAPPMASPVAASAQSQQPLAYTPQYLTEKILASRHALTGERKQVTVVFADLKGSMELIQGLDPEEARQILDPALQIMMDAVHRYEGTVNQVLGDGIMALFGAPLAHEDHAARACYAALAMQAGMRCYGEEMRRTHGIEVQLRVGLNSGEVVVRAIGNDLHMDYSAVGQTTHLAARMEQLAIPGSIRLTAATLRLVEGLVLVQALGLVPVKGLPEPVEVFELLKASAVRRRLQAAVVRGLTRFIGRQDELDVLYQALQQTSAGQGQVIALIGEAGVGKSRLVYELLHSHRTQGWLILESTSVSYGKATPYFPVLDLLKRYCHVEDGDDTRTIRAKVTGQVLTLDAALQEALPALLALLDAVPEDSPFLTLDPALRRRRTIEALRRVLLRESQVQPLLLVCEDLHWIDSETQALLDSLVENLPMTKLLLLVNYRPEYQHTWGSKTYYTQLRLHPLPPESAEAFLQVLLGSDVSLAPLKPLLTAHTGGNPFFLEETVRTLVETGVLGGAAGAYRLAQAVPSIQVPATVQAVLAARIDRLPREVKQLLQVAAVIGMEVSFSLLHAIAAVPTEALHRGLGQLQATEFLYETRLFPEREYTFKHALTYEVAYSSLLQERRRALHAQIVDALTALAGDRAAEQVERLAHHALRGEVWDKALAYFRQAGERAMARSAHHEAVGHFEQALAVLQHLPETRPIIAQGLDLRLALRSALLPSSDAARILVCLREAEALAANLDERHRLGQILGFLSVHFRSQGVYDQAIDCAQRALTLATTDGDAVVQALAHLFLGAAHWGQGAYRQAIASLIQTVTLLPGAQRRERFGQANLPAVQALAFLAACHAELGLFADGKALGEEGLQIAEAVAHPSSLMWACYGVGLLCLRQGNLARAIPLLERAVGICAEADLRLFVPRMAAALGDAYTLCGRIAEATALLVPAMTQTETTAMAGFQALCSLPLATADMLAGRPQEAQARAERTLALAYEHQERSTQAYTLHLLGTLASQRTPLDVAVAETYYQQALSLVDTLGMRPLLAHCHRGLATLYARGGRLERASAERATAMTLYQAMDMSFWLLQAESVLAPDSAVAP